MKAEILTIGDELLIGQVVDTNSAYLASQLNEAGIDVARITSIRDDHQEIMQALGAASERAALVLITGGLGPTRDDITKKALAAYFEDELVNDAGVLAHVQRRMEARGLEMNILNVHQADILSRCRVVHNELGTAPGMWMEHLGVVYVSMPGVPFEMIRMFDDFVLPWVRERFSGDIILHRVLLVHGISESALALKIESWESSLPDCLRLAYLPSMGIIRLRITAHGNNRQALEHIISEQVELLRPLLEHHLVSDHAVALEEAVGEMLKAHRATLAVAESCTGGGISRRITSVPGSSEYFYGGVVAYSNELKATLLRVSRRSLATHGAVSDVVVQEMARGLRSRLKTDYVVATSGIAGPGGGSPEKPVETVWIAVDSKWGTVSRCFNFQDGRERIMERTITVALTLLIGELSRSSR